MKDIFSKNELKRHFPYPLGIAKNVWEFTKPPNPDILITARQVTF